jgi:hypothetical protein
LTLRFLYIRIFSHKFSYQFSHSQVDFNFKMIAFLSLKNSGNFEANFLFSMILSFGAVLQVFVDQYWAVFTNS